MHLNASFDEVVVNVVEPWILRRLGLYEAKRIPHNTITLEAQAKCNLA
jgi:hypothetical protein